MNSLENVLDSKAFCPLLCHDMGALLTNKMKPEWDLLVFLFAACEASTYAVVDTCRPLHSGMCGGNLSLVSR